MNNIFQDKYLKYEIAENISLEQIFYKKYLLYKKKYLALKNQLGGVIVKLGNNAKNQNTISINNLPSETDLDHLQAFLIMKGIPLSAYGMLGKNGSPIKDSFAMINFTNNVVAGENFKAVQTEILNYTPNINIKQLSKYLMHIQKNSKMLYIALPIPQESFLGRQIQTLMTPITGDPYKKNMLDELKLEIPHLSLLQILIPNKSNVYTYLSIPKNFYNFIVTIKEKFKVFSSEKLSLYSKSDDYQKLNIWVARMYNDDLNNKLGNIKQKYTKFIDEVSTELILKANPNKKITTSTILPNSTPSYIHYSIDGNINSELCISSYYYDKWEPHISLAKIGDSSDPIIQKIKKESSSKDESYINLWGYKESGEAPGSLSCVFATYDTLCCYQDF